MRRFLPILVLLVAVIAAPIVLRRNSELAEIGKGDDRLVIITPHNDTIRSEFGEAFARHWKEKTGRTLNIDWRIPGGTSDISRVLESSFKAADEIGKPGIGIDLFFGGGEPDFRVQADKEVDHFAVQDLLPAGFEPDLEVLKERRSAGGESNAWSCEQVDVRDDRLILFGKLATDARVFSYPVKPTVRGIFVWPGLYGEAMYDPRVYAWRRHRR